MQLPEGKATLLVGAALAATAAGAAAYVCTDRSRCGHGVVVFLDGSQSGISLDTCESIDDLKAQVEERLHINDCRLFLEQAEGKPELTSSQQLAHALASPGLRVSGVLLLLATADGQPLSSTAQAAPKLLPIPAGPKPLPVVGSLLNYKGSQGHPMYNFAHNLFAPEKQAVWGDTVLVLLPNSAGSNGQSLKDLEPGLLDYVVATCDPEVVGELLGRQDDFPKLFGRRKLEQKLQVVAGNGLFTSSTLEKDWKVAHGLLPRSFNQIRVKNYFPVLLDKTRSFVSAWAQLPQGATVTDLSDWLTCMTADAVVKASMGLDMGNVEAKAAGTPLHKFIAAFRFSIKAAVGRATVESEFGKLAAWNPFFDGRAAVEAKAAAALKDSHDVVNELLEKTRKGEIGGPQSVLSAMLNDVSPTTGDFVALHNIFGQVMNLMIAGHETTAAALAWSLYYIATHPEVESRALAEIQAVLGERSEPRADDVPKLVYLEACFREALRLHPSVPNISRDVAADTTLKGKWFVRKGQRVDINNVALQRREEQWGGKFGDATSYNPDRFLPGAAEETGRHPNAFNPWGFGVRACIGSQFALWEAKLFLCMMLRCFKFRVAEGFVRPLPSTVEGGAAPNPHPLKMRVWKRDGCGAVLESINSYLAAAKAGAAAPADAGTNATPASGTPAAAAAEASHGTPLLILYGSNTGTCEELAATLAGQASAAGFAAKTATLDSVLTQPRGPAGGVLPEAGAVLIISSTYNGTPPDNAAEFARWLSKQGEGSQSKVMFSVFGVGNSQWAQTYQAFPTQVALQLARAGATQVMEMRVSDVDGNDWMEAFDEWQREVLRGLLVACNATPPDAYLAAVHSGVAAGAAKARLHLRVLEASEPGQPLTVEEAVAQLRAARGPEGFDLLEVLANRELQGPGSSRSTRHVQLALPGGEAGEYSAGDHMEVMGNNDAGLVKAALQRLGLNGSERVEWRSNQEGGSGSARSLGGMQQLSLVLTSATVLTWLVDLAAVPTKRSVSLLAEGCGCPPEAAKLRQLATEEGYKEKVLGTRLTLVELLSQFQSVSMSLEQLANLLPRMGPRYYSISSSPLARPGTCSISVGRVSFTTPSGRQHKGAASATIGDTPVGGKLLACVRQLSSNFRLPKDPATPVIMVGPGTGVAPMMGFLQERAALAAQGAKLGPAHLFFGCRSAAEDFIYRAELESYLASGVLSGLHVACSRDGPTKVYAQDLILQEGPALWGLFEAGAHVYVCGDARRMAPDVRNAFKDMAQVCGGRNASAAESWMGGLLETKRYLEDVWAG